MKRISAFSVNARNAVILGGSTNLQEQEHPYLTIDRVLHEISHWFVHQTAAQLAGSITPHVSNTFDEFMADVMATIYLDNPCRARKMSGECARDLSKHSSPLNKHLWHISTYDFHRRNEPVAHFFWDFYKISGLKTASSALWQAFGLAQNGYPYVGKQFNSAELRADASLGKSIAYQNEFEFATRFTEAVCQNGPQENLKIADHPCNKLQNYLGYIKKHSSNIFVFGDFAHPQFCLLLIEKNYLSLGFQNKKFLNSQCTFAKVKQHPNFQRYPKLQCSDPDHKNIEHRPLEHLGSHMHIAFTHIDEDTLRSILNTLEFTSEQTELIIFRYIELCRSRL